MSTADAITQRHVEHCMGTVFSIDVRAPGVSGRAVRQVVAWLHHVDRTFSTYRADSVISRINAGTVDPGRVPSEVTDVLTRCSELTRLTDGYFSAYASGSLDPSGYVKGWAIERASDLLLEAGSTNHCVNGGGDVQCVGAAAPDRSWSVGVAHPLRSGELIGQVHGVGSLAVATSGSAERGQHIIDPLRRRSAREFVSVTVVGTRLADVDAYATAAFAMGPAAYDWLVGSGLDAMLVHADGSVWQTGAREVGPTAGR